MPGVNGDDARQHEHGRQQQRRNHPENRGLAAENEGGSGAVVNTAVSLPRAFLQLARGQAALRAPAPRCADVAGTAWVKTGSYVLLLRAKAPASTGRAGAPASVPGDRRYQWRNPRGAAFPPWASGSGFGPGPPPAQARPAPSRAPAVRPSAHAPPRFRRTGRPCPPRTAAARSSTAAGASSAATASCIARRTSGCTMALSARRSCSSANMRAASARRSSVPKRFITASAAAPPGPVSARAISSRVDDGRAQLRKHPGCRAFSRGDTARQSDNPHTPFSSPVRPLRLLH